MPTLKPVQPPVPQIVPAGQLKMLSSEDIKPSSHNPRHLFDHDELIELKNNIAERGVLVPITAYQAPAQTKFSILDGERRYRCVLELNREGHKDKHGHPIRLPANIVEPPTKIAGLLYMFNIHNLREQWELMPTALGLKIVMEELGETDNKVLTKLTGLSDPQIERCKKLLAFPEQFQKLSLDPNPKTRIPSNFWIEALPVLNLALEVVPTVKQLGRTKATEKLVDKYRGKRIKSVIHFRRIMEAYQLTEEEPAVQANVVRRLEEFFLNPNLDAKQGFEDFIGERKRVQSAISACDAFLDQLQKFKLRYTADDDERKILRAALKGVREYCKSLEEALKGTDDPEASID
jgi:ParB family chromosome partitioning protein